MEHNEWTHDKMTDRGRHTNKSLMKQFLMFIFFIYIHLYRSVSRQIGVKVFEKKQE